MPNYEPIPLELKILLATQRTNFASASVSLKTDKRRKEISMFNTIKHSNGTKHGIEVLRDPQQNKSTAFTETEREALGLTGLLPAGVDTEEIQVKRVLQQLEAKPTDLERYIYLTALQDSNETLFFKVVMSDPGRFLPILYDPTVGEACLKFGHIFRHPRGIYLSLKGKGRIREVLRNWHQRDVRFICV